MGNAVGGASLSVLFEIDSAHTTITNTPALMLDEQVKTDIQTSAIIYDTIKFDPEMNTFLDDNATTTTGGEVEYEKVVLETTISKSAGSAGGRQNYLDIVYGPIYNDGGTLKRIVTIGLGTLSADAGEFSQEAGKYIRPKFQIDLVAALKDITIAANILDSDMVNTEASGYTAPILKKGRKRQVFYLPAAPLT